MNSKKTNWLFLTIILAHFAALFFLIRMGEGINFTMAANCIVSELIILVPGLVFLAASRGNWNENLGFAKVRISSLLLVVLFTFLSMPLVTVLNAFSMLFAENAVVSMESGILEVGFPGMLFLIGIYGPFCEEFVFRGMIFRGYKKSGSTFWAILLSSLLFGLMHMNINQAIYAFAIGILLALLVEATGSLWGSVFCHMVFNSSQVVLMFSTQWLQNSTYGEVLEESGEAGITPDMLLMVISVYLIIAAITTPLAFCVLAYIAKRQGREENLKQIWSTRKEKKEYLVSIPLVLSIVVCLAYISMELLF